MMITKIIKPLSDVASATSVVVPPNSSIPLRKLRQNAVYNQPLFMCNVGKPMPYNKKKAVAAYKVSSSTANTMTMPA
ncbi:hypothetical protein D3C71_1685550 [compost metagenome]